VIALLMELLHHPGHRRQRRLELVNILALARRQLTKRQQIDMRGVAQPGVAPVGAVDRGARPARFVAEIDVEKKRSMLSGLASTTSTVSPSNCSAQASAAVIDVVPVPPRTPCNPRIAIDGFLTFSLLIQPVMASVLAPRLTARVGKYRGSEYQAGKMPGLTPGNHFETCSPKSHRWVQQALLLAFLCPLENTIN
jgi:hypothetical protein